MGDAAKRASGQGISRRDLAHYGRTKTSALLVGTPFGYASRCAGFEPYTLPADNYCIGVRLDWVIHKHGALASNTGWRGLRMWPPCFNLGCKVV
jgi:hypothetical protein